MSIRVRLTGLYAILLATVLITFSLTFYGVLRYSLYRELDRNLAERSQQIVQSLRAENDLPTMATTGRLTLPELDIFSAGNAYIQIINMNGQIVDRSMSWIELPTSTRVMVAAQQGQPSFDTFSYTRPDYQSVVTVRYYNVPITFNGRTIGLIQIGRSLQDVELTLRQVSFFLLMGNITALVLAVVLGGVLTHFSLRPINRITTTANTIVSARDLGQRLPVSGTNDELDRLSHTINNMLHRLDEFFQAQVRLGADISHELKTPLTIIRGNLDLLRAGNETPEERAETIAAIESAINRMSRLVSDLLLLAQADAGLSLRLRPMDLEEILLDVFQQAHALSRGVDLRLGHVDEAGQVNADEDRLKQLLINLMDNALKHTPQAGRVTLSMYRHDEAHTYRIVVADTGPGIPAEHLPHIFNRFYRVKGQKSKGAGLGLAIAKWIAEAHQGSLTVESQPSFGSTFTVTLPQYPPKTEEKPTRPEQDTRPLPELRTLIRQ